MESIGHSSFHNCTGISEIELPENLKSIGSYAFEGCSGIAEVSIPNGVTSIGGSIFSGCSKLKKVTFEEGMTKIPGIAMNNAKSVEEVKIPSTVKEIGNNAFENCTGISKIELPSGLESIGHSSFHNCTGISEIKLPENLKSIGSYAFEGCTGIAEVTVKGANTIFGANSIDTGTTICCFKNSKALEYAKNNGINYRLLDSEHSYTIDAEKGIEYTNNTKDDVYISTGGKVDYIIYDNENILFDINKYVNLALKPSEKIIIRNNSTDQIDFYSSVNSFIAKDSEDKITYTNIAMNKNYIIENSYGREISLKFLYNNAKYSYAMYELDSNKFIESGYLCSTDGYIKIEKDAYIVFTCNSNQNICMPQIFLDGDKVKITESDEDVFEDVSFKADTTYNITNKADKNITLYNVDRNSYLSVVFDDGNRNVNKNNNKSLEIKANNRAYLKNTNEKEIKLVVPKKLLENSLNIYECADIEDALIEKKSIRLNVYSHNGDRQGTIENLDSLSKFNLKIYNKTKNSAITDYVRVGNTIVLPYTVDGGDSIDIEVSRNNYVTKTENVTLNENGAASVRMDVYEKAYLEILEKNTSSKERVNICILGDDGKIEKIEHKNYSNNGTYRIYEELQNNKIIVFKSNSNSWKVNNISAINALGMQENRDYYIYEVSTENAKGMYIDIDTIPTLDINNIGVFAREELQFGTNKTETIVNSLILVTLKCKVKQEFENSVKNLKIQLDVPDGIDISTRGIEGEFYLQNSGKRFIYVPEDNSCEIRFYIQANEYKTDMNIVASASYNIDGGQQVSEILGETNINIPKITLNCPESTASKNINVYGIGIPNSDINLYKNGELETTVKTSKYGKWTANITLDSSQDMSVYSIYAELGDNKTDEVYVRYSSIEPQVESFDVYYSYHGITLVPIQGHIDLLDAKRKNITPYLRYWPNYPFTLKAKIGGMDNINKDSVTLYAKNANGTEFVFDTQYDETTDSFVGTYKFNMSDYPSEYCVSYETNDGYVKKWREKLIDDFYKNFDTTVEEDSKENEYYVKTIENVYDKNGIKIEDSISKIVLYNVDFETEYLKKDCITYFRDKSNNLCGAMVASTGNAIYELIFVLGDVSDDYIYKNEKITLAGLCMRCGSMNVNKDENNSNDVATARLSVNRGGSNDSYNTTVTDLENGYQVLGVLEKIADCMGEQPISNGNGYALAKEIPGIKKIIGKIDGDIQNFFLDAGENLISRNMNERGKKFVHLAMATTIMVNNFSIDGFDSTKGCIEAYNDFWYAVADFGAACVKDKAIAAMFASMLSGLKINNDESYEDEQGNKPSDEQENTSKGCFTKDTKTCPDPSGFVYEVSEDNPISGVTASIYYKDDNGNEELWTDAPLTDQINPQLTAEDGSYMWDVPFGEWKVKFEKEGYETAYTDWLPVPPPQIGINIPMKSTQKPNVKDVVESGSAIVLNFDKYMQVDTINSSNIKVKDFNDKSLNIDIIPVEIVENDDKKVSKHFKLIYTKGYGNNKTYTIAIDKGVTAYNNITLGEDVLQKIKINNGEQPQFIYGDADNDGQLTSNDSASIFQKVLLGSKINLEDVTDDYMKYVDVDGDGLLTASDSAYVLQKVLDSNFCYPIESER